MSIVRWLLGIVMFVAVLYFGLQVLASETGEVVVLYTEDGAETVATRLWVVDHQSRPWLRAGVGPGSGWYGRLQAEPRVTLERDGVRRDYLAAPAPDMTPRIDELMRTKYAWRDLIIGVLIGGRDDSVAVRLEPVD